MEVWNSLRLRTQIDAIHRQKRTDTEGQLLYVLTPFIASLGYDTYDIERVDTQVQLGRITVKAHPNVTIIFAVTNVLPIQEAQIFVSLDSTSQTLKLYFYAMDSWELVENLNLTANPAEISEGFTNVLRMISAEGLQITYAERGKRMFTERVLATKLQQGDYYNKFTAKAIRLLFDHPSDLFIQCIAEVLTTEFSTESANELFEQLRPLQEQGIRPLISEYVQQSITSSSDTGAYNPTEPISAPKIKPTYVEQPKQEVEEVVPKEPTNEPLIQAQVEVIETLPEARPPEEDSPEKGKTDTDSIEEEEGIVVVVTEGVAEVQPLTPPTVQEPPKETSVPKVQPKKIGSIDDLFGKPVSSGGRKPPTKSLD